MNIVSAAIIAVTVLAQAMGAKGDETQQKATRMIKITAGKHELIATVEDNATAAAFVKKLPLTIEMNDFNANEKVHTFPECFPVDAVNPKIIRSGDLMLYGSSTLVLFYENFATSYSYTRIGKVNDASRLKAALGRGSHAVTFELIESKRDKKRD